MKYTICAITLACAFAAQDSTPPVISLNLATDAIKVSSAYNGYDAQKNAYKTNPTSHSHYSANSFARRCNVVVNGKSTTDAQKNCPSPDATAYDHHQGDLTSSVKVLAKQFVTSAPNTDPVKTNRVAALNQAKTHLGASEYKNRGEFVLTYNVQDASGNAAEELVFAMIMVDREAPKIVMPTRNTVIEACLEKTSTRCVAKGFTASATDSYDVGTTRSPNAYRTFKFKLNTPDFVEYKNQIQVELKNTGAQTISFKATDFADIFGEGNQDNVSQDAITYTVVDNTKPRILLHKYGVSAKQNVCGAQMTSITSLTACREWTATHNVPGVQNTICAGCNDGKCYSKGSNSCESIFYGATVVASTVECADKGTQAAGFMTAAAMEKGEGATCVDDRLSGNVNNNKNDLTAVKAFVTKPATFKPNCAGKSNCVFSFKYECTDGKNAAVPVTRKVTVADRKDPTLLIGVKHQLREIHGAGSRADYQNSKGHHFTNPKNPWAQLSTIQHSAGFTEDTKYIKELTERKIGNNAGSYTCTDTCDLEADLTTTVTWNKCSSTQKDCCASQKFDPKYTKFDDLKVGDWCITYTCTDTSNNKVKQYRNLRNEDHAKPVITILGGDQMVFEASNSANYVDAGATCMDQVDGNISQDVEVSGDVVNLARVGTYKIFYNCQDTAKNRADTATRTVTVQDTTCPTCYFKQGRTQHRTLVLEASFPYTDQFAKDVKCSDELTADITPVPTTYNSNANGQIDLTSKFTGKSITDQTGIYFTVYKATDDTKNSNIISKPGFGGNNCKFQTLDSEGKPTALTYTQSEYTRTITVKDTLRPVIKLSLKDAKNNDVIIKAGAAAKSSAADISYQQADASFPQPDGANKPHTVSSHTWKLMAEETTSSVNGWVLGAIASAVSGLALLGYSLRKQAQPVATSVPV
jgi:hypothetical protein